MAEIKSVLSERLLKEVAQATSASDKREAVISGSVKRALPNAQVHYDEASREVRISVSDDEIAELLVKWDLDLPLTDDRV